MSEEKQLLISRIELGETEDGKPVVEMYEANPRLRWPALRLFDLSRLFVVGIDPNELQLGEERFVRFHAFYVESDRTNKEGNHYKDCVRLEAIETNQDSSGDKFDGIIALLQSIDRRLASIHQITEVVAAQIMRQAEENAHPMRTLDSPFTDLDDTMAGLAPEPEEAPRPASQPAAEPEAEPEDPSAPVLNEDMARRRFGELAGPAMRAGKLDRTASGRLTSEVSAGAMNWRTALRRLEAAIAEHV